MLTIFQYLAALLCFAFVTSSASMEPATLQTPNVSVEHITGTEVLAQLKAEAPLVDPADVDCMARTMYYEARGEGRKGMAAVGHVIVNRTTDKRFPSTVCGVVQDGKHANGKPVKNRCQFSWYCSGTKNTIKDQKIFEVAREIAREVLLGKEANPVGKSLFFHAVYVEPEWRRYSFKIKLGNHLFYA